MVDLIEALPVENRIAFFKTHLDESPLGFFLANDRGLIEYVNAEAARIIGFDSTEQARGHQLQDIEAIVNCGLDRAFQKILSGENLWKNEHRCTNRQGHFAVLNIFCSPYRSNGDGITGIFGIIQDVTQTFREKNRLEEAHYLLSVISQVSEAVSSTAELEEVLRIILTGVTAHQGLGFNRAFLFLINETDGCLEGKFAIGPGSPQQAGEIWSNLARQNKSLLELLNDHRIDEKHSPATLTSLITGWQIPLGSDSVFCQALDSHQGLNIRNRDGLSRESLAIMDRLQTDYLALAPIVCRGRKLGLIAADNQITGRPIVDSRVKLLHTFANHSAVAIEHSQLYENLSERANELEEKNRQLAQSQEQIIRSEKMSVIGELTSSIAHELRNPLTVIGGFANMILSAGEAGDNAEYLNIILTETQRAEGVLNHVLDFSRASRTKSREIDFNLLASHSYEMLLARSKVGRRVPKLVLTDGKLPIWGNPDQLQHALLQFMRLTVDEMTDECVKDITTSLEDGCARMKIRFDGADKSRAKVMKTLSQIFGNSGGTQKLSIIVAGETIRYHGGNYGVEGSQEALPRLYVELPLCKGGKHGQNTDN